MSLGPWAVDERAFLGAALRAVAVLAELSCPRIRELNLKMTCGASRKTITAERWPRMDAYEREKTNPNQAANTRKYSQIQEAS
jgi:hypothetical protein